MASVVVASEKRRGRKRKKIDVNNVVVGSDGKKKVVETRLMKFVGRYVRKEFEGSGIFLGKVTSYDSGLYRVSYEDGDFEDLDCSELKVFLIDDKDLDIEWYVRKEKLDKLVSSEEISGKVTKVEQNIGKGSLCESILSNDDDRDNAVVKGCADGHNDVDSDSLMSDSVDESQELDTSGSIEAATVPQPELPASSGNIGVPEASVSHLFSVYSFLRSFSSTLFIYPFSLDDFVGALNCPIANTLLDSVHVALMRVLKSHFERLSADDSELASKCLRLLNWSLLDTITWPVFVAHYLMITGHINGPDWNTFYTHSFSGDYYTLSAGRKLIILQILCDGVLNSDELRAELDMREESEFGIDIDSSLATTGVARPSRMHSRSSKTHGHKKVEAIQSITEHNDDEDGNGDECRLCGMDGFLLCCDGCPLSYHARCIGLTKMHMSSGSWYCPECKINETEPKVKQGTTLLGGVNFGVDPYEQVFVATCDHLLVLKASINSENSVRFYNRQDIHKLLHAVCKKPEHVIMYSEICRGIMQHWELAQDTLLSIAISEVGVHCENAKGSLGSATQLANGISSVAKGTRSSLKLDREADPVPHRVCLYMGFTFKINGYINNYLHGDFAASAAANLATLSSEENQNPESRSSDNHRKAMSASVSLQVRAFSSASLHFLWPNTEKKLADVPRERCSWCISCKATVSSKKACLLNAAASSLTRRTIKVVYGVPRMKNGDGRLTGVATHVLFVEESLSGLVDGPFLNDTFRKRWCGQVEQASNFNALKILLLELEENIRPVALSGDWVKLVDGGSIQSSTSQTPTATASNHKRKPGRRGRKSSTVVETAVDDFQVKLTDFAWWRGSQLSKLMFHRAVLPSTMLRKAARQGGSKRIPGIHYFEGQEIPKTSRQLLWRSAVEMSRNTSQLGLQVRYLDFYVRWSDIVRPDQIPSEGKGPEAEASAYRNALICDKKITEKEIRYCVDFHSQKHLPSRIMKNIAEVEKTSADGEERYWFSETCIPLYLIKEYEEKAKKIKTADVLSNLERRQLKASRKNKLLNLLRKHNGIVTCCSCRKDVLPRDGIKCNACQGLCHNQCASGSTVSTNGKVEFWYLCKQCCETRAVKDKQVRSSNESPRTPLLLKIKVPTNADAAKKHGKSASQKVTSSSSSSSSVKAREHLSVKKLTIVSGSASKKNRTNNWGLIWKKLDSGNSSIEFRSKYILPKGSPNTELTEPPVCRLCIQAYNADLMYIFCETCQYWFHADALELKESEIIDLVGFKCCRCRKIRTPVCPYTVMDPNKKKALKVTFKCRKPSNSEVSEMDSDISQNHMDVVLPYALRSVANAPLPSLSDLDQCTDGNSDPDYCLSDSTARKLPVRRQNKLQTGPVSQNSKLPIRRHKLTEINRIDNGSIANDVLTPQPQWDASTEKFDNGIHDMEFEPQTYLSFNDILINESQDVTENSTAVPGSTGIATDQVETNIPTAACKICHQSEPCPNLFCRVCEIWIHRNCSPWDEDSSSEDEWKCGGCREWK